MPSKESLYPKDWFRIGFLLSRGWSLRRIHELDSLLNDAVIYEPSLEEFREACLKITEYYLEERYPSAIPSKLNKQEVAESLKVATKMIEKIRSIVT